MYYKPINMATPKWNQFKSIEDLYDRLEIAFRGRLSNSRKHKAYFLFSVLFSEAYWLEDNLTMVQEAVHSNTLDQITEKRHPDEQNDDNIDIYFLEDEKGQYFIVLVYNQFYTERNDDLLNIIPVKTKDYLMTQIYPLQEVKSVNSDMFQRNW